MSGTRSDPWRWQRWARQMAREHELSSVEAHVLLLIATYANEAGEAYPLLKTLADDARHEPDTVSRALTALRRRELIERRGRGPGKARMTRLTRRQGQVNDSTLTSSQSDLDSTPATSVDSTPATSVDSTPATNRTASRNGQSERRENPPSPSLRSGGARVGEDPHGSGERPQLQLSRDGVDAAASPMQSRRRPDTYRGKRVPDQIVTDSERLLEVFCDVTSRRIAARTADYSATSALKQVQGAMLARPDVTVERWEAGIRATAKSPPDWVRDRLELGHVFGERAAEWTVSRGEAAANGHSPGVPPTGAQIGTSLEAFRAERDQRAAERDPGAQEP